MKKHYHSFKGSRFANILSKVVAITILIMVWILIDKGNAAGQSMEVIKQGVRSAESSAISAQPLLRKGDARDGDEGEDDDNSFDIYPNPVKDDLIFDFEFTVKSGAPYIVTDALGRLVDQGSFVPGLKSQKLDFSKYRSGMYLVRVQLGGTAVVKRIIKS